MSAQLWYGQVKKIYRHRRLVRVAYQMRLGQLSDLIAKLREWNLGQVLNTAFVERVNLALRQGVPALVRRTWSTAQEQSELNLHLEWGRGYYHFVRPHQSLRVALAHPIERGGSTSASTLSFVVTATGGQLILLPAKNSLPFPDKGGLNGGRGPR